jgi:hypothetical protein
MTDPAAVSYLAVRTSVPVSPWETSTVTLLGDAIHDYEVEMRRYSAEAVRASKQQMNAADLIHRPVIGRLQLAAMRNAMRTVNAVPPLKRRVLEKIMRVRGEN